MSTMMVCGHAANATVDGQPGCAICTETRVASSAPDLTGRRARCSCGVERPSDPDTLAFFEFLGAGSREAVEHCQCGMHKVAHATEFSVVVRLKLKGGRMQERKLVRERAANVAAVPARARELADALLARTIGAVDATFDLPHITQRNIAAPCTEFVAKGAAAFDRFYCGCRGWD